MRLTLGGRFAEILIPWAKAESRAEGCVPKSGRRKVPCAGWSCLGPAEAPTRLESPTTPCIATGTPGTFPELASPVNSCCDVPFFLLSLSRCCWAPFTAFAMIHGCSWQQMVVHIK